MTQYYISKVLDDFYMECLFLPVKKMTPSLIYVDVPLYGMVTIEIEIPIDAVEIEEI